MTVSGLDTSHEETRLRVQSSGPHDDAHDRGRSTGFPHHPRLGAAGTAESWTLP